MPFEERRRRLAEACLDPYTSVGREAAQAAATDRCQPTTAAACRTLALKNGLTWGGSAQGYTVRFGCYAYAENGRALFGTGGTETQKLQDPAQWLATQGYTLGHGKWMTLRGFRRSTTTASC